MKEFVIAAVSWTTDRTRSSGNSSPIVRANSNATNDLRNKKKKESKQERKTSYCTGSITC